MLFNEPKLLKFGTRTVYGYYNERFSALQRAEIAEIITAATEAATAGVRFSALQRAEIAEIPTSPAPAVDCTRCFSALQRAEIAEIVVDISKAPNRI